MKCYFCKEDKPITFVGIASSKRGIEIKSCDDCRDKFLDKIRSLIESGETILYNSRIFQLERLLGS